MVLNSIIYDEKNWKSSCKMYQILSPAVQDCLEGLSPDTRMSADILIIMHNIPSRKCCRDVFFIVNHAKWLRIRGCKLCALKPKAYRQKRVR